VRWLRQAGSHGLRLAAIQDVEDAAGGAVKVAAVARWLSPSGAG